MSLCIVILGQERSFFRGGSDQFLHVLNTSKTHYSRIHVIYVLSGSFQMDKLNAFIEATGVSSQIIHYDTSQNDVEVSQRIRASGYLECKYTYFHRGTSDAARGEIGNPDDFLRVATYQFHQLKIAIDAMKTLEPFDVVMKTRYDVWYHPGFYPMVAPPGASMEDKILVNNTVKDTFKSAGIDVLSTNFMNYLKEKSVHLPECRVAPNLINYSLGGGYLTNHVGLSQILDGSTRILYCLNDHVIFGGWNEFIELRTLCDEYGQRPSPVQITHYYAQEAQLLIFCFNHGITPLMYLHNNIHTIIR